MELVAPAHTEGEGGNGSKGNLFYDYCKKSGYTKDRCYRLHEFPQDFKFTKGKNGAMANVVANSHDGYNENTHGGYTENTKGKSVAELHQNQMVQSSNYQRNNQTVQSLTKEQYSQLLTFLNNNFPQGNTRQDPGNFISGAVNLAGRIACYSSMTKIGELSYVCKTLSANSWIIDSGATNHMTYNKALLTNIITLAYPFFVTLPNGYKVRVTEAGNVYLSSTLTLCNVLFVLSFKFNLISVHCLCVQLKSIVSFSEFSCLMQAPSLKRPLEIGRASNGLYYVCPRCHNHSSTPGLSSDCSIPSNLSSFTCFPVTSKQASPSHSHTTVHNAHSSNKEACCNLNTVSHIQNAYVSNVYDTIFPSTYTSHGHSNDLLWHHRLGHVPFVRMKGIPSLSHLPATQSFVCTIYLMARQARLPFPKKTSPSSSQPFELLHLDMWGPYHIPTYDKFKYFLTLVDDFSRSTWTVLLRCKSNVLNTIKAFVTLTENQFATIIKTIGTDNGLKFVNKETTQYFQDKDKFEPRAIPHIFVGYPFGSKGYKVLNLATRKLHVFRYVVFHESVFHFTLPTASSGSSLTTFPSVVRMLNSDSPHLNVGTNNIHTSNDNARQTDNYVTSDHITINDSTTSNGYTNPTLGDSSVVPVDPPSESTSSIPTTSPTSHFNTQHDHTEQLAFEPKRTSRTHVTPPYLQAYNYNLPNLQSSPHNSSLMTTSLSQPPS
ncbi:uncharacterized protein LOC132639793 [Lycium barbarum]|uniref:uncharacterized protein LOC132639793 n=1 Tax=Lycium barbarum TaxID=112863 RepID=UPI00293F22BC|nr:uncharacterized protein LOC132639793 [Lycium barbarum]